MNIQIEKMASRGYDVSFISVTNNNGFRLALSTLGAGIYDIYYHQPIVICPFNKEEYLWSNKYYGKSIGRVSGRIKNSTYQVNGVNYQVDANDHGNCLHGGYKGWAYQNFDYEVIENDNHTIVSFSYLSKDKESGFNGNVKINIKYVVENDNPKFTILFEVESDQDTIINLTNHAYFTLDMHSLSLDNQKLIIPASKYIEKNELLINLREVDVTDFMDFRKGRMLTGFDKSHWIDHDFVLDTDYQGDALRLECQKSGIGLSINTDMPIVHLYSSNEDDDMIVATQERYQRYCSLAIECTRNDLDTLALKAFKPEHYFISYAFDDLK